QISLAQSLFLTSMCRMVGPLYFLPTIASVATFYPADENFRARNSSEPTPSPANIFCQVNSGIKQTKRGQLLHEWLQLKKTLRTSKTAL
uniref:Uncharacterized protein n=1 Tax=Parascaris univalens TaxID=6257 RepID=A0A915A2I4_PARUN